MTTFSFSSGNPSDLVAGGTADMSDISGSLTDIATFLNAGSIDKDNLATSAKPATVLGAYRTLSEGWCGSSGILNASGTYMICGSGAELNKSPASVAAADPYAFYLDGTDYAVSGLTAKVRVRGAVFTNGTAPAVTFTFGLYPVTFSGGAGAMTITAGTVVSSSTAAIASPSANSATSAVSSDISIPTAGAYSLAVAVSGATAVNSTIAVHARLELRHV